MEARISALEAQVARIVRLETDVADLKHELAPLKLAHRRLCARSLLVAELGLIQTKTGVPVRFLADYFTGFHTALEWAKRNAHSTITTQNLLAAQQEADRVADSNVRRRVRLAALVDAHPNLLDFRNEDELLDIMDAFPVSASEDIATVDDVYKVVRLFLFATGQHLLARSIRPRPPRSDPPSVTAGAAPRAETWMRAPARAGEASTAAGDGSGISSASGGSVVSGAWTSASAGGGSAIRGGGAAGSSVVKGAWITQAAGGGADRSEALVANGDRAAGGARPPALRGVGPSTW